MQTFPKPLTPGEERACLERLQEGDREARDILIERNLRLVAHVAKKYQGTDYEQDDLLSVGTIGLIKAVNTFHPERGSRLATYAAKCIENEILMMFRAGKKYSREVSLFEPIGVDKDGESVSLVDVIELETKEVLEDLILDQDIRELYEALKRLTQREQTYLLYRYGFTDGEEHPLIGTAIYFHLTKSRAKKTEEQAMDNLWLELPWWFD